MNKFSAASYFETTTTASNMSDESEEENQLEIEEVNMDKLDSAVVNPHFAINNHKIKQSQQTQSTKQPATRHQHYQTNAMQLDGDDYEVMSTGEEDEDREGDYEIIDPDDDEQNELNQNHLQQIQQSLAAAAISSLSNPNQVQDASIVQSLATQVAAAMAAVMAAQQLMTSAASICGLDMTSLSNFATSQAQQQSPMRQNGPQTPEQLMAAAVAATSFLQNNQSASSRNPSNPNATPPTPASATIPPTTAATATATTIVPEDLTMSQQQQQSLANGLFGVGLGASGGGRARSSGANSLSQGNSVKIENCSSGRGSLPRSDSAMSAANAFMASTLNEQLVAAVQGNIASKMALVAAANGSSIGMNQQQQQSINSASSNYLYHHFGQDAVSQQLSNSILAAAQAAAAAQQQLSNVPNQSDNHRDQLSQQRQQALQLSHLNHLSQIAAAGGPLAGQHHHQSVGVSHHNHLTSPTSNQHNHGLPNHHHHHHSNQNPLGASLANGRSALLNNTSTNSNNNNTNNNGPGNGNNNTNHNNNHHHNHHHPHHTHSTPTRHLLGHHHHSSIQTQQQLLATKGYNPLAASIGQQTEILTPTHLRKAKLMFFYVRYPSSSTLKECFRDVRFNKNNTAQLVKWFSNFREFYYIQMEKFARDAINDDRIKCKEDIVVNYDHELINQLNNHYNKNRHIESADIFALGRLDAIRYRGPRDHNEMVAGILDQSGKLRGANWNRHEQVAMLPEVFRQVVEETLRHFFDAIHTKRDQEQSWKKAIYKIIQRMDQEVPDVFKTDAFNEHLE